MLHVPKYVGFNMVTHSCFDTYCIPGIEYMLKFVLPIGSTILKKPVQNKSIYVIRSFRYDNRILLIEDWRRGAIRGLDMRSE